MENYILVSPTWSEAVSMLTAISGCVAAIAAVRTVRHSRLAAMESRQARAAETVSRGYAYRIRLIGAIESIASEAKSEKDSLQSRQTLNRLRKLSGEKPKYPNRSLKSAGRIYELEEQIFALSDVSTSELIFSLINQVRRCNESLGESAVHAARKDVFTDYPIDYMTMCMQSLDEVIDMSAQALEVLRRGLTEFGASAS